MGKVLGKLKPPWHVASSSEAVVPIAKRKSVNIKPAPPEPQVIMEQDQNKEENLPDPKFAAMSQHVVGIITTRSAGQKEHPTVIIKDEYIRPRPLDRHTTLLSGPDEDTIQSPGTLNHTHIRELFLLYQGKTEGQEKPLDVETLAKKFNVDSQMLREIFDHLSLVHFEMPIPITIETAEQMKENNMQQVKDEMQNLKGF